MVDPLKPPLILKSADKRIFAIGDIHGCLDELNILLESLVIKANASKDDIFIFIGDYIDRGPNSAGVIERLLEWEINFPTSIFLCGNHEQFLIKTLLGNEVSAQSWLKNGAIESLQSWKINLADISSLETKLPKEHLDFFLDKLERYVISDDFIFVHAGINPSKSIFLQLDETIYWVRDEFIHSDFNFGKRVIFGHTPVEDILIQPNKIGIDTGCVYNGSLSAINLTEKILYQVFNSSSSVDIKKIEI
jgi:serine/threonine protein phosphatase 1